MARRRQSKPSKRDRAARDKTAGAVPSAPPREIGPLSGDYRVGLALFVALEVVTVVALATAERTAFGVPQAAAWRNGYIGLTGFMVIGAVGLWLIGPRTVRSRLLIALGVVWILVLVGRLATAFVVSGTALPAVVTVFIAQLVVALMVPAAVAERARGG